MYVDDQTYERNSNFIQRYIQEVCLEPTGVNGWTMHLRRGTFNPVFLDAVSLMFIYKAERFIDPKLNFQITGLETGATPLLTGIAIFAKLCLNVDLNMFVVRKEIKEHGYQHEGIVRDRPVLIVDDLCNSSASMKACYDVVSKWNVPVLPKLFSIVNVRDELKYMPDFEMVGLFTMKDFKY